MKKAIYPLFVALILFSCNVTKPKDPVEKPEPHKPPVYIIPRDGLMAEYLLDLNANDSSDNNNKGTINGAVPTTDRFGNVNGALLFDGVDDTVRVENHSTLHSDRGLTLSGWLKVTSYDQDKDWQIIFWKGEPQLLSHAIQREYGLWLNKNGLLHFNSTPADGNRQISYNTKPGLVEAGKWAHFVCIVDNDNGKMALYLNGKLIEDTHPVDSYGRGNIRTSSGPLVFGNSGLADVNANRDYLKGALDDVRIYSRVLSTSEIEALYKAK